MSTSGDADDLDAVLRRAFGPTDELPPLSGFATGDDGSAPAVTLPDTDPPAPRGDDAAFDAAAACVEACGRYVVVGELGRGGMGIVLAARDRRLGRLVAVKVLHELPAGYGHRVRRFVEEVQISGQLQHPAIVPVYDVHTADARRPFFTMRHVRGRTLAAVLADRRDPADGLARAVAAFRRVAEAVGYAHVRGVVHRDLKPSNVMLGPFGEVFVMDWGLAKLVGGEPSSGDTGAIRTARPAGEGMTLAGAVMGTPEYMAPEQARGDSAGVDRRADVFALGAILCEILTGRPPTSTTTADGAGSPREPAGARPSLDDADVDAGLAALASECLAADPAERPADAVAVARRVEAWEASLEERARTAELAVVAARARAAQERRVRRLTQALGAVAAVIVVVVAAVLVDRERRAADLERRLNDRERTAARLVADARTATPDAREAAWLDALRAAELARETSASGPAADDARARIAALAEECEAEASAARAEAARRRRRAALAGRLEAIAVSMAREGDACAMERSFRELFAAEGIDVSSPGAGAALATHEHADLLVEALHRWIIAVRWSAPRRDEWSSLRTILDDADRDRDRMRLVNAALDGDVGVIERTLTRETILGTSASTLDLVATAVGAALGPRRAADLYRRAAAAHRSEHDLHLGHALWAARLPSPDWNEVARACSAALALRPDGAVAHYHLGRALAGLGDFGGARREFEETLDADAGFWKAHETLARIAVQEGDADRAAIHAARLAETVPGHAETWCLKGAIGEMRGRPEEALAAYRRAFELEPLHGRARMCAGRILRAAGRLEEAAELLTTAARQYPGEAAPWYELGLVRELEADADAAVQCMKHALAADPDFRPARLALTRLLPD